MSDAPSGPHRPAVRRHHRRRHGAAVASRCRSPHDKRAEGAALQLASKMGMDPAMVVHAKAMGPDFTFFVVYGSVHHLVDLREVEVVERDYPLLGPKEVNSAIKTRLRRRLVVVGACIGTDAHTVGIDAILNIKGFAGEKGLEYYREIKVVNLGAQVSRPRPRRAGAGRAGRRGPGVPGRHPAGRAPAQHPRDVGRVPRGVPRRRSGRCSSSAARASTSDGRRARRRQDIRQGHDARRGGAATSCTALDPDGRPRAASDRQARRHPTVGLTVTHRRYVPYATPTTPATWWTGRTCWACSATSPPSCASAPTATRACSPRTPTSSSSRRCGPATSSSRPRGDRVGPAAATWRSRPASCAAASRECRRPPPRCCPSRSSAPRPPAPWSVPPDAPPTQRGLRGRTMRVRGEGPCARETRSRQARPAEGWQSADCARATRRRGS